MRWKARKTGDSTWEVEHEGVSFAVEAAPGEGLLPRLDSAVRTALGVTTTPGEPKWSVQYDEHHAGGLFELEITYRWYICDATGTRRWLYEGEASASYAKGGGGWDDWSSGGVDDVAIGLDGEHVLVRSWEGVSCRELPLEEVPG